MKRIATVIMVISLACLTPFFFLAAFMGGADASVGIIGGADAPTWFFVWRTINPWIKTVILFNLVTALCSLFCLIFSRTVKRVCRFSTTLISLGLSAVGAVGCYAGIMFLSCFLLTSPEKHPVRYPASGVALALAFGAFVLWMWLYVRLRRKNKSVLGVFLDIATALLYFLPLLTLVIAFFDTLYSVFQLQNSIQNLTSPIFCGMMVM